MIFCVSKILLALKIMLIFLAAFLAAPLFYAARSDVPSAVAVPAVRRF